jgi:SAM-dependent methyltransferase
MARLVGLAGSVLGIDMDPVKVDLARRDAVNEELANVECRCSDATGLDLVAEFDVVYARFLLTHLGDPLAALGAMVGAAKPGAVVVIEDLDHSAVFAHPRSIALDEYVALYNDAARLRGGDPEIGPKLPAMLRRAGLVEVQLSVVQPAFTGGDAKRIHEITLANIAEPVITAGLASEAQLSSLAAQLASLADDPDTIVSFPRIFQVSGRRPGPNRPDGGG